MASQRNHRVAPAIVFVAAGLAFAACTNAATKTWTGATDTDWATAGNWTGGDGAAPVDGDYGDIARFAETAPTNKTPTLAANRKVQGLNFDNSVGWSLLGGGSKQLTLRTVQSSGSGSNTVTTLLKTYQGNLGWTVGTGNTLNLTGGLYHDGGGLTLTVDGGGTLAMTSAVGGWSNTQSLKINDATVRIAAAAPYSNNSSARIAMPTSVLELQTTVAAAQALIGTKVQDDTGLGLGVTDIGGGYVRIAVVPEPATLSAIAGLAVMALRRRRR